MKDDTKCGKWGGTVPAFGRQTQATAYSMLMQRHLVTSSSAVADKPMRRAASRQTAKF